MVATELLKLAMETDEERKARLKKMVATTLLKLAPETEDERRARLEYLSDNPIYIPYSWKISRRKIFVIFVSGFPITKILFTKIKKKSRLPCDNLAHAYNIHDRQYNFELTNHFIFRGCLRGCLWWPYSSISSVAIPFRYLRDHYQWRLPSPPFRRLTIYRWQHKSGPTRNTEPQRKLRDRQIPLQNGTTAALRHFKTDFKIDWYS